MIKTFKRKEIYNIINNYYNNNNKNKKINISPLSQKNNIINIERKKTSLNNKEGCILKNLIKKYKNSYNIQNNTIDNLGRSNVVHNMINNEEDINKTPKYEKKRCRINKNIKKDIFSKEIEKEKNKNNENKKLKYLANEKLIQKFNKINQNTIKENINQIYTIKQLLKEKNLFEKKNLSLVINIDKKHIKSNCLKKNYYNNTEEKNQDNIICITDETNCN